jgi:hypothetical protein
MNPPLPPLQGGTNSSIILANAVHYCKENLFHVENRQRRQQGEDVRRGDRRQGERTHAAPAEPSAGRVPSPEVHRSTGNQPTFVLLRVCKAILKSLGEKNLSRCDFRCKWVSPPVQRKTLLKGGGKGCHRLRGHQEPGANHGLVSVLLPQDRPLFAFELSIPSLIY